jgi:hypothetical protein
MDRGAWKALIVAALDNMANEELQRRSWTGIGPEVSSPIEMICALFDDAILMEFIAIYRNTLSLDIVNLTRFSHIEEFT